MKHGTTSGCPPYCNSRHNRGMFYQHCSGMKDILFRSKQIFFKTNAEIKKCKNWLRKVRDINVLNHRMEFFSQMKTIAFHSTLIKIFVLVFSLFSITVRQGHMHPDIPHTQQVNSPKKKKNQCVSKY